MDFMMVSYRSCKKDTIEIYPKFIVGKESKDLIVLGGEFTAIWLEDAHIWSTNENDAINAIDAELDKYAKENSERFSGSHVKILHLWDTDTGMAMKWKNFYQKQYIEPRNFQGLNGKLIFANVEANKEDYSSKKLPYALEKCETPAYDELISTLYSPPEREKIEWCIGAVVNGASKTIHKFLVMYGPPNSGKSTIIHIIEKLFAGYYKAFDAESLGSATDGFALEQFKSNPLVGICHDGDFSKIERNTRINSITSHEEMVINVKHKNLFTMTIQTFLIMGTNKPVKITDAKSGIIRRLIDAHPTGKKIPNGHYNQLLKKIDYELGGIAWKCKEIYESDPLKYENYKPLQMMGESNDFYNYVLDQYVYFSESDGVTLKNAWARYNQYCEEARVPYPFSQRVFKAELSNYFRRFDERIKLGDEWVRSYFSGFKTEIFEEPALEETKEPEVEDDYGWLNNLKNQKSIFDELYSECPAQLANEVGTPYRKWDNVTTKLKDIDTTKLHYIKPPEDVVVIDFDYKDDEGNKSLDKNLKAAKEWPQTYAEVSKSGQGLHLVYTYTGDVSELENRIDEGTEIKIFTGNSSLRRKLTLCNDIQINPINSGLPLKGEKKLIKFESIKSEKALRTIILKNLRKEYHGATAPSVDFIYKVLEDSYNSGLVYNVEDLYPAIISFAANSSNQADKCIKLAQKMKLKSENNVEPVNVDDPPIVIFDVESFPNLFLVNWKILDDSTIHRFVNPTPKDIELLMKYRLVGFNNRKYDNHMIYACYLGETPHELNQRSQNIINGASGGTIGKAWDISYTDIYDFSSTKQSLKKWEVELGIHHKELGFQWDKPVPEDKWNLVSEYCDNDVLATEAVWHHLKEDYMARLILADLAGMTPNDTTNSLTARIIFGKTKQPQLNYTDLKTGEQTNPVKNGHKDSYIQSFPDYEFVKYVDEKSNKLVKKNMYHDLDLGLGGLVLAKPGMYGNVALLDVESMHPHSIIAMDALGEFTENFHALVNIRLMIKHGEYDKVRSAFDGKLAKYIDDEASLPYLSKALKIPINAVYGLTYETANPNNPFRDPRNENNFIALRGALFIKTLAEEVEKKGFNAVHVKTDSIKIPDATPTIISFCMGFATQYGYKFEHEATYERFCLVNNAVYIAKYASKDFCMKTYGYIPSDVKKHENEWTATGAQFQNNYVFKTCFTHEPIEFADLCESRSSKTAMYLKDDTTMRFIGKVGLFCPVSVENGGKSLVYETVKKDGTIGYNSVTGCKNYTWIESEDLNNNKDLVDRSYFNSLVSDAIESINKYGDYEWFVSDEPYIGPEYDENGAPIYETPILIL